MLIRAITQPDMQKVQKFPLADFWGSNFPPKTVWSLTYLYWMVQDFNLISRRLLLFRKKIVSSPLFDHFRTWCPWPSYSRNKCWRCSCGPDFMGEVELLLLSVVFYKELFWEVSNHSKYRKFLFDFPLPLSKALISMHSHKNTFCQAQLQLSNYLNFLHFLSNYLDFIHFLLIPAQSSRSILKTFPQYQQIF